MPEISGITYGKIFGPKENVCEEGLWTKGKTILENQKIITLNFGFLNVSNLHFLP